MSQLLFKTILCLALVLACSAAAILSRNATNILPEGVTIDNGLLCTPSRWTTVVTFYLGNYLAHVATVRSLPGEKIHPIIVSCIAAFGLPSSGIFRGLEAIIRCSRFRGRTPLERAAHAGALCMVVRSEDWEPPENQSFTISGVLIPEMKPESSTVHSTDQNPNQEKRKGPKRPPITRADTNIHSSMSNMPVLHQDSSAEATSANYPPQYAVSVYNAPCLFDGGRFWGYYILSSSFSIQDRIIHGFHSKLPKGYKWAFVPRYAKFCEEPCAMTDNEALTESSSVEKGAGPSTPPNKPSDNENEGSSGTNQPVATTSTTDIKHRSTEISSSYNVVKALAALIQTAYAIVTLYRARSDQIDHYGIAAFGLTVAPYAVMSVINLIGSIVSPDYPALYMVGSEVMREAEACGGRFVGVVGTLKSSPDLKQFVGPPQYTGKITGAGSRHTHFTDTKLDQGLWEPDSINHPGWRHTLGGKGIPRQLFSPAPDTIYVPNHPKFELTKDSRFTISMTNGVQAERVKLHYASFSGFSCFLISLISLCIVLGLSKAKVGSSTKPQRIWTMTWLGAGIYMGSYLAIVNHPMPIMRRIDDQDFVAFSQANKEVLSLTWKIVWSTQVATLCIPAIGGLVVVGQMLMEFGSCTVIQ